MRVRLGLCLLICIALGQAEGKFSAADGLLAPFGVNLERPEEFRPTKEWQIVKEGSRREDVLVETGLQWNISGQQIPSGLHVRLNLATGLREAKLLDDTDDQPSNSIVAVPSAGRQRRTEFAVKDDSSL